MDYLLVVAQSAIYARRMREQMRTERQLFTNLPLRPCWERDLMPDRNQQLSRWMP